MNASGFNAEVEKMIFSAFISARRRSRFLEMLDSSKRREKLRRDLAHFCDFDQRFILEIPPAQHHATDILARLRGLGAPAECYLISENSAQDGRTQPLSEALHETIGKGFGTIVSCLHGQLAFYEGEGPSRRYILHRIADRGR